MTFYLFIFSYFLPIPVHEHEMVLHLLQLLLFRLHNILFYYGNYYLLIENFIEFINFYFNWNINKQPYCYKNNCKQEYLRIRIRNPSVQNISI